MGEAGLRGEGTGGKWVGSGGGEGSRGIERREGGGERDDDGVEREKGVGGRDRKSVV